MRESSKTLESQILKYVKVFVENLFFAKYQHIYDCVPPMKNVRTTEQLLYRLLNDYESESISVG